MEITDPVRRSQSLVCCVALAALAVLALGGIASAHGTDSHVAGTVSQVGDSQVVVRGADGRATTIALTSETRFRAGDRPARREDVRPGARVIVDVVTRDGETVATLVRLAPKAQGGVP